MSHFLLLLSLLFISAPSFCAESEHAYTRALEEAERWMNNYLASHDPRGTAYNLKAFVFNGHLTRPYPFAQAQAAQPEAIDTTNALDKTTASAAPIEEAPTAGKTKRTRKPTARAAAAGVVGLRFHKNEADRITAQIHARRQQDIECPLCSKIFPIATSLRHHMRQAHQTTITSLKDSHPETFTRYRKLTSLDNLKSTDFTRVKNAQKPEWHCSHCTYASRNAKGFVKHVMLKHRDS